MLSIEKTWLFIIDLDLDGSRPPRGSRSGWRLARAAKSLQRQPELRPCRAGIFPKRAHVNVALAVGTAIAAPARAEPVPARSPPGPAGGEEDWAAGAKTHATPTSHRSWLDLLQEDDGSVYLLEDIRNLPEAGGEEAKHSPFATVQAARSWLEDEFADLAAVATEEQSRQTH